VVYCGEAEAGECKGKKLGVAGREGGEGDLCVVCLELLGDGLERSADVRVGSLAQSLDILRELRVERKLAFVGELLDEQRHSSLDVCVYQFRHRDVYSLSCMRQCLHTKELLHVFVPRHSFTVRPRTPCSSIALHCQGGVRWLDSRRSGAGDTSQPPSISATGRSPCTTSAWVSAALALLTVPGRRRSMLAASYDLLYHMRTAVTQSSQQSRESLFGPCRYGTRQRSRLQHASCPSQPGRLCPAAAGACSLRHTYEGDPKFAALPTFAVIPAMGATDAVRMSSFLPRFNHVRAHRSLYYYGNCCMSYTNSRAE